MPSSRDLHLPVIDVSPLVSGSEEHDTVAEIEKACCDFGFFYIVGHGVDEELQERLEQVSRQFFAEELQTKLKISMSRGGRTWRGYFPVGGELTSGKQDLKEGIYFGAELDENHPLVRAGTPLHGQNLFPSGIPQFRKTILDYMEAMTRLGHALTAGISLSLGLEKSYFRQHYTYDPLILFRIFNYPPRSQYGKQEFGFGVGEHTDYGFLTILKQDMSGGLQVKTKSRWIDATPIPNSFVCNIGDMLDRLTGGRYLSAPHRVQNRAEHDRLSFPFFFDPNFNAEVKAIRRESMGDRRQRWDGLNLREFQGTYGDYLLGKVSKVFPELGRKVL